MSAVPVQTVAPATFTGPLAKTITITPSVPGNILIVRITAIMYSNNFGTMTVNDGSGYTAAVESLRANRNYAAIWFLLNAAMVAHAIVCTATGTAGQCFGRISVSEYGGIAAASPVDRTGANSGNSKTPSVTASGANAGADDLVVSAFGGDNTSWAGVTTPPNAGYPSPGIYSETGNSILPSVHADKILTALETSAADLGTLTTASNWAAVLATFKTGNAAKFRRSRSPTGSRTGARQLQA